MEFEEKEITDQLNKSKLLYAFSIVDKLISSKDSRKINNDLHLVWKISGFKSKKMFEKMDILSKNGLAFKTGLRFFKNMVCDYSKRHVYCCNGDQHPSETQVKKLKVMSSQRYPEDIMCSAIDGYTCASPTNCRQGF